MTLVFAQGAVVGSGAVAVARGVTTQFPILVWRLFRMNCIRRTLIRDRALVLTYDDGPSPAVTPQILDLLQEHDSRATFFALGSQARLYPSLLDRVVAEGHEVGCHSDRHLNAWKVSAKDAIADITGGFESLSRWIRSDGLFRPPYGKLTFSTYRALCRRRAPVCWWTIDSGDTKENLPGPSRIVDKVKLAGGGIVLLHDGSMSPRTSEREKYIVQVTRALLEFAKEESFRVVPLGQYACTWSKE